MDKMLIFGGTGSLGKSLLRHLTDQYTITVFSRDEAKHVAIKNLYPTVGSVIGDVRDLSAVRSAILDTQPSVIINASALKNVPEVEEVPMEGIKTSLSGTDNINTAARDLALFGDTQIKVLTISTDKAAKPVNSYGMAKALQERLHIRANRPGMVCNAVRYGNVLESRGSLIPLLKQRFQQNLPVYVTHPDMTRFFLTLDASVDLIKRALEDTVGGHVFIPKIVSARIVDVIDVVKDWYDASPDLVQVGKIRPGEKLHEVLISQEETSRTQDCGSVYVIHDILSKDTYTDVSEELHSNRHDILLDKGRLASFLHSSGVFDA